MRDDAAPRAGRSSKPFFVSRTILAPAEAGVFGVHSPEKSAAVLGAPVPNGAPVQFPEAHAPRTLATWVLAHAPLQGVGPRICPPVVCPGEYQDPPDDDDGDHRGGYHAYFERGASLYFFAHSPAISHKIMYCKGIFTMVSWTDVLGWQVGNTLKNVKRKRNRLALAKHPDRNPSNPRATAEMQAVLAAWENALRHYEYNNNRRRTPSPSPSPARRRTPSPSPSPNSRRARTPPPSARPSARPRATPRPRAPWRP